jgi:hypothetical protein
VHLPLALASKHASGASSVADVFFPAVAERDFVLTVRSFALVDAVKNCWVSNPALIGDFAYPQVNIFLNEVERHWNDTVDLLREQTDASKTTFRRPAIHPEAAPEGHVGGGLLSAGRAIPKKVRLRGACAANEFFREVSQSERPTTVD